MVEGIRSKIDFLKNSINLEEILHTTLAFIKEHYFLIAVVYWCSLCIFYAGRQH